MSGNQVNCIYRDHRGFLWIGTTNGLNEYDGRNINVYKHNRFDSSSIVNDNIISITEDKNGFLWLGTFNGISKFNPYNHKSRNFIHDDNDPYSLNDDFKCIVYIDKNNTCWIGNESGLSYFDPKTNHFIHVQVLPDSLNKQTLSATGSMMEDNKGRFWVGTRSGLVLFNRDKKTYTRFTFNNDQKLHENNSITYLFCDHAGRIWVGTWGHGINEFDPVKKIFLPYIWNKNSRFAGTANIVNCITETQNENGGYILWVGSTEGLLKISGYPVSDKTVTHILPEPSNNHSLNNANVKSMFTDNSKILWIGTNEGINQYSPRNRLFSNTFHFYGSPTKIITDSNNHTICYYISAWYGNGLTLLGPDFSVLHTWPRIPENSSNPNSRQITDILIAKDYTFWIATFYGLYHCDRQKKIIASYLNNPNDPNSISNNKITSINFDSDGNLWIGTYGSGLDILNPETNKFQHFRHNKSDSFSIPGNLIWNVYIDKQKNIWIIADNGVALYNKTTHKFKNYIDDIKNPNTLKGRGINGMLEDNKGIYWIITDKGLNRFDHNKNQFTLYSSEEGLNNDNIQSFTIDKQGILWMCTPGGISSFNPVTKNFINYNEQNGLPEEIFGPMITLNDGAILAGGNNKLLRFNPSLFKINTSIPNVYITQLSIAGKLFSFNKPPEQNGTIILKYPENSFTCSFTSPDFYNGDAVKYAYQLSGIDADWIAAGNRNYLSYSNLAAGDYTLHIRAANSDGIWNKEGTSLKIKVLPPFWDTVWFRVLLALAFSLAVYFLFISRVKSIRNEEAIKTKINKQMADMRLKVLRTRINPHFMFNALNSIQECIYTKKTDTASKYLTKFSNLLRLILEQSENTFITIHEEIEILKLYLELESLRFDDGFNFNIREEKIEIGILTIPPLLIQPFVENALWHGLRHKEGKKELNITFNNDDEFIYVTIEDNGIGRAAAKAFTSDNKIKKQSLGIKISEEEMQMMGSLSKQKSEITIEDLYTETGIPSGTKVHLTIPILCNQ